MLKTNVQKQLTKYRELKRFLNLLAKKKVLFEHLKFRTFIKYDEYTTYFNFKSEYVLTEKEFMFCKKVIKQHSCLPKLVRPWK